MINLKLKTDVGELTAVFISDAINNYKTVYMAYIEEYPGVITQVDSIQEGMDKLPGILDMILEVEIKSMMEDL